MDIHFIDVGCGNMTLIILPDNSIFVYDCNITADNKDRVLSYLNKIVGLRTPIAVFITSHRDADHMRGIKILNSVHPIGQVWDTGVPGTTTDTPEYREYMGFLKSVITKTIKARTFWTYGDVKLRCMNSEWEDYSEPNEQSVVLKIEYKGVSVMLSGDTSFRPWKEKILPYYSDQDMASSILLAAHHGSLTFFDDPSDTKNYFVSHIKKINPAMTIVSVGPNSSGLPASHALELYEKYSTGSDQGNKVFTTEDKGTIKLILGDGWRLSTNQ